MPQVIRAERVTRGRLGLAVVLLIGVLTIAYGYYRPSRVAEYAGLLLTLVGIIMGVVAIVIRGGERQGGSAP
jgi:hypothetical protein